MYLEWIPLTITSLVAMAIAALYYVFRIVWVSTVGDEHTHSVTYRTQMLRFVCNIYMVSGYQQVTGL